MARASRFLAGATARPRVLRRCSQLSAARGRELAVLLDPDTPVPGITQPPLRPTIATIGVPATTDGRNMRGDDFAITAGWGHFGSGHVVMPGPWPDSPKRAYTASETLALGDTTLMLGETTFDIHLNGGACWRNVPRCRLALQARGAIRSSRSGSPTANTRSWDGHSSPKKSSTSPTTARRIAAILTEHNQGVLE